MVDRAEVVPGETVKLRHTAVVRLAHPRALDGGAVPERHRAITQGRQRCARTSRSSAKPPRSCPRARRRASRTGCARRARPGCSTSTIRSLIGRAREPARVRRSGYVFDVGGQTLVIAGEPMPAADPATPALRRRLEVIAPVSLRFIAGVRLLRAAPARPVTVELTAARARAAGTVQARRIAAGWSVTPASQPFLTRRSRARARALHLHRDRRAAAARDRAARRERGGQRPALSNQQRVEVRRTITCRCSSCGPRRAPRRWRSSWRRAASLTSATCRAPATTWPRACSRWATRSRR